MKQGPNFKRIEDNMRSGPLAAHQFLGTDTRTLADVILHDQLLLEPLGLTNQDISDRMRYFTDKLADNPGPKNVDHKFRVEREEHKGRILCPFADNVQASKSITRVTNMESGKTVVWSDLNIHLIASHGFYEGYGAPFRVDPAEYAEVLEIKNPK
ncbi:MAG TPA: hypothetical protein DDZ66_08375 [Firmicutes bacterium]|jgi:hypothetical protein|nr:hypothetical protein [Bacillota bacterium]